MSRKKSSLGFETIYRLYEAGKFQATKSDLKQAAFGLYAHLCKYVLQLCPEKEIEQ
jgi:hypothetical protein